jgi:hypothetical protein
VRALCCTDEPRANTNSQDSSRLGFEGSHHRSLYNIFCAWPQNQHPNIILSWDSPMGVPKFQQLGLPWLWRPITLHANLQLRWSLKQSCNPCWGLSNGMLHATCTWGNQGDPRLLVVGSQIANVIFGPSFGHNLSFKCFSSTFQELSDDIRNSLIHWVLTLAIVLWRFENPLEVQLPR